jgi:predicted amidohydrolase YtcJ
LGVFLPRVPLPFVAAVLALAVPARAGDDEPADLVVLGRVFTADAALPWAEAVAVRANRIVQVGQRDAIDRLVGPDTRVIDAAGGSVLPGFNDAHCHLSAAATLDKGLDLSRLRSLDEILGAVRDHAAAHPGEAAIVGMGWHLSLLPDQRFPGAALLDAVVADRPVLLWSEGPHAVWANTLALSRSHAVEDAAGRGGLRVVRDPRTGEPSGVVLGRGLLGVFREVLTLPDLAGLDAGLRRGLAEARRLGLTSVQEPVSPFLLPALADLHDRGELTLRFSVWTPVGGPQNAGPESIRVAARLHGRDGFITFSTAKTGIDGMPELRTAALLEPYADEPGESGLLTSLPADLFEHARAANAAGFACAVHATGDAGVRLALDAFEAAEAPAAVRNRVEHLFLVDAEDIPRFAELGVVASVQPAFLARDISLGRFHESRWGPERCERVLPLRSLLDAGAVLAFGTDHDLTPLDPLVGLHAAVMRQDADGQPQGGWMPGQRLSLEEAVRAYTAGSAFAEGAEAEKGRLLPGFLADIVVLSADIFALPPAELRRTSVRVTVVDGKVVYEAGR